MGYCSIITSNIVNIMNEETLIKLSSSCEKNCYCYSQCDTIALMNDELKLRDNEGLQCPYCGTIQDKCDCPDLFYKDLNNSKALDRQAELLETLQGKGFNIVTCGHCGQVFIHLI